MAIIKKKDKHPLAINILKLQRYNFTFLSCEEVVLYEYLIVKAIAFKQKPFYHSSETIFNETGVKKHSLHSILKRFQELGYVSIEVKGMPRVKHFTIHFPKIVADFPFIYQLEENGKPLYEFRQLLTEFFQPLVENYQEKYINKNNKEENKKEKKDTLSEVETNLSLFDAVLAVLKTKFNLKAIQYHYTDEAVLKAFELYSIEELEYYMTLYFNEKKSSTLKNFFKFESPTSTRLIYIEDTKRDEIAYLNTYTEKLQDIYNNRIRMFNEDNNNKRGKSETKLIFNDNIKIKLKEALEIFREVGIEHAFIAYTDAVLKGDLKPEKFMPYFLSKSYGEFNVIENQLDRFNLEYGWNK